MLNKVFDHNGRNMCMMMIIDEEEVYRIMKMTYQPKTRALELGWLLQAGEKY